MNRIKVLRLKDTIIERPIWSVMIPTYNCAQYLQQTLQSVLVQDKGADVMEIWVVDDCSTEDSPEDIVAKFGEGRVKFYKQSKNVGQLNNFETCLNLARGKIIHLLHGDDFVHVGFYDKLEKPLLLDDAIGAGFTRNNFVDSKGNLLSTEKKVSAHDGVLDNFLQTIAGGQVIQTPSIVVKREVYEKLGGFDKDLSWCEDWEMWVRIANQFKFYYTPETLASYRSHGESNTSGSHKTGRFIEDIIKGINTYAAYLAIPKKEKERVIRKAKKSAIDYAFFVSYNLKYKSNDRDSALKVLRKSFKLTYSSLSMLRVLKQTIKYAL